VAEATVLFQGTESHQKGARLEGDELWLTLADLTSATGWALKPEGVCKDEICVPVPAARRSALIHEDPSGPEFDVTEFARLIEQPFAHNAKHAVWCFGSPAWEWKTRLASGMAPDFSLPDLAGHVHTLSELRGNKVFLLFWATW
jgi:hypothetical protein